MISVRPTRPAVLRRATRRRGCGGDLRLRRKLSERRAGLSGPEVPPNSSNVTLWRVGDYVVPPTAEDIDAIVRQAGTVERPPFRLSFGGVKSLSRGALVLCAAGAAPSWKGFRQPRERLIPPGTERKQPVRPQMTLIRSETILPERRIKAIGWTVREIVLVHRLLGKATQRVGDACHCAVGSCRYPDSISDCRPSDMMRA